MSKREEQATLRFLESLKQRIPENEFILEALGDSYTRVGRYEEGLEIDLQLSARFPGNPTYWYNLGCSYARLQRPADALSALERGVALGYDDAEWMARDEDLASLHAHPEFKKLVARVAHEQKA